MKMFVRATLFVALVSSSVQAQFNAGTQTPEATLPFTMTQVGAAKQLNWTIGALQSSTNVAGPYLPVPGATSPFTMPTTGPRQFYRIKY